MFLISNELSTHVTRLELQITLALLLLNSLLAQLHEYLNQIAMMNDVKSKLSLVQLKRPYRFIAG